MISQNIILIQYCGQCFPWTKISLFKNRVRKAAFFSLALSDVFYLRKNCKSPTHLGKLNVFRWKTKCFQGMVIFVKWLDCFFLLFLFHCDHSSKNRILKPLEWKVMIKSLTTKQVAPGKKWSLCKLYLQMRENVKKQQQNGH